MQKSLWVILTFLFVSLSARNGRADTLTVGILNFTVTSGSPAPVGSFVYDNTTATFSSFIVSWDGLTFDFTATANLNSLYDAIPLASSNFNWNACAVNACFTPPATNTFFLPFANGQSYAVLASAIPAGFNDNSTAGGTWFATETTPSVSEPSSIALIMSGVGLLGLMLGGRKRISLGHEACSAKRCITVTLS